MSVEPLLVLLVCGVCLVDAAKLGSPCSTSNYCTAPNSYCFKEFKECAGKCACYKGYQEDDSADICFPVKNHGQGCNVRTDICAADATCTGSPSQCMCPTGLEFNIHIGKCVTTDEREAGASCDDNTGCYMGSSWSECVANTGTTSPKFCRCRSGYLTTSSKECRMPTYDETCNPDVGCDSVIYNPDDTSQVNMICTLTTIGGESYKCSCPAGAEMISTIIKQTMHNVCLTTFPGTKTALGNVCSTSNTCDGKLCALCPGAAARICATAIPVILDQPCSANADCTATLSKTYCHKDSDGSTDGTCKCVADHTANYKTDVCTYDMEDSSETMRSTVGVLLGTVVLPFLNRLFFY